MATRLELEYDGSGFRGWAVQPGQRTIQGELESALRTLLGRPVDLSVAGRTDAGVHAWGQVASFDAPPGGSGLRRSLNGVLAQDVSVLAASETPEGFDARRDARSRTYCYRVLSRPAPSPMERGRALWWPRSLDREAMAACAEALAGEHDFTAFTPTDSGHIHFGRRVFAASWAWDGALGCFWIEADAFLRNMVRALVGTMLEVGGGGRTPASFASLLSGAPRSESGDTVAAHGLYLASVRYGAQITA